MILEPLSIITTIVLSGQGLKQLRGLEPLSKDYATSLANQ